MVVVEGRDKVRVAEIFYFLPNMLAPPSKVDVSQKKKSLAHLQLSEIGLFLIARLRDIWGSYGPTGGSNEPTYSLKWPTQGSNGTI